MLQASGPRNRKIVIFPLYTHRLNTFLCLKIETTVVRDQGNK